MSLSPTVLYVIIYFGTCHPGYIGMGQWRAIGFIGKRESVTFDHSLQNPVTPVNPVTF
jgi:hypothetical protein